MVELIYLTRGLILFLICWLGIRIIGKKSVAEMTSYDMAGVILLVTIAAEPMVYKITTKASSGVLVIAIFTFLVGKLSLNRWFYGLDAKPVIVVENGKINEHELKRLNMNLPLFLSELRVKGYPNVSDVEFAIMEPLGKLSVIPKSQSRPLTPKDLQISTEYEGLGLPLILDGDIQYKNLEYANLTEEWLRGELLKFNLTDIDRIFLAELNTQGQLYFDLRDDNPKHPINPNPF